MENKGLAFAWHTWHRLAGGVKVCSYVHHHWYLAEPMKMWMLICHPRTIGSKVLCSAED